MDLEISERSTEKDKQGFYLPKDIDTVTDGYAFWSSWCPQCGYKTIEIVRPGKVQCSNCE
jgi:uncharacterized Zn finger protein (UPF0148 family)